MKRIIPIIAFVALLASCGVAAQQSDVVETSPSEEVVDVGYGKEVRGRLTTAVSSIPIKEDNPIPYRTIYEMIEGRCPGVTVQGDKILIRGISSINSSTEPLIIVDGTPQTNIDWINPNDVKSIDVLKDGGSSAIYGSRGANGVIIINLK